MYRPQLCVLLLCLTSFLISGDPKTVRAEREINTEEPGVYKGRKIAYTMHALAAHWLIRKTREREESVKEMIKNLGLKPGMVVADVGCGNGYHALMMSKLVGDKGKILCVDVQQKMLDLLDKRAKEAGIKNYELILGEFEDPKLPKGKVDLVLVVDAYHEFTKPVEMLARMRQSLAPGGKLVLLEFRAEDPTVPIKPDHKMSKKQIMIELTANKFKLVHQYDNLPWQHMMFFGRDDDKSLKEVKPAY